MHCAIRESIGACDDRPPTRPDRIAEATRFLKLLHQPGDVFEIRVLGTAGKQKRIDSGFFDDPVKAAECAVDIDGMHKPMGCYVTLNPLKPAILARAANRIREWVVEGDTASDQHVRHRNWLPIDVDPTRDGDITKIMATPDEIRAAWDIAESVRTFLCGSMAWGEPIECDSGNGRYLLFPIDMPNNPESAALLQRVLLAVDQKCSRPEARVDLTMFNASRIIRVMGTKNRKGDSVGERVHRYASVSFTPDSLAGGRSA